MPRNEQTARRRTLCQHGRHALSWDNSWPYVLGVKGAICAGMASSPCTRNLLLMVDVINALQDPVTQSAERGEIQRDWIISSASALAEPRKLSPGLPRC